MAGNSNQDDSDLANLQSSFDEQQAKISALREIIRQTEAVNDMKHATAQEKVKNIAQRLTHFKTKVTTSRLNRAGSIGSSSQSLATIDQGVALREGQVDARPDPRSPAFPRGRSESSGMEKCSLLRQQIEQNRLKMAERESREREIEEKVIEIKHKLEATQQSLERSGDRDRASTTCLPEIVSSVGHVTAFGLSEGLRRSFSYSFLDPGPSHEAISTPTKPVPDSEEQFNDELTKFENNVRQAQVKRKSDEMLERRVTTLEDDLHEKERIIDEQLRALTLLVNSMLEEDNKSDLELVKELHNLQMKLLQQSYSISNDEAISRLLESYGYDPLQKATERKMVQQQAVPTLPAWIGLPGNADDAKVELYDAMEKISTLEQALASQDIEMERLNQQMTDLRQSLEEKTIELNVMTANVSVLQEKLKTTGPKPLFPRSADEELESETTKLKQQLDDSNKNMIKCKLKIKQLQKQVDTFKKTSNVHAEIAKLTEENATLAQRLAEVGEDTRFDATEPKPVGPELQKRIEILELTCQNQATAMQLLEEQKNDLSEDLNRTRHELQTFAEHGTVADGDGDNGRIASQMLSIELEEQLEKCLADKSELTKVLHSWEAEKSELQQKLKRYAEENAELLGKIDKLSLEKVSSAESIEILENLTLREKQEMENSEKHANEAEDGATELDGSAEIVRNVLSGKEDINESLLKLMEESKELMDKVELFTDERREVLEKLDAISIENQAYVSELDKLKEANEQLRTYSVELASAKSDLEDKLRIINEEKECIRQELDTVKVRKLEGEENSGTPSSLPVRTAVATPDEAFDNDVFQQTLLAVETEITNFNKNKDKQKKIQLMKKLTVSAKTLVTMSRQLMDEYGRCMDERTAARTARKDAAISTLETKLHETIKCLESKASESALLQEEIALLKHELEVAYEKSSDDEPELLKVELNSKNDEIMLLKKDIDALVDAKSSELLQIQHRLLEAQQENHQLKTYTSELQYQLDSVAKQQAKETEALNRQIDRLQSELRNAVCNVPESASEELEGQLQHKQETIDTLNGQIIDLYRTVEEHQSQMDEYRAQKEQIERKNEELLEKLKKFAANLKKKNVQCSKLEKDMEALKETNRQLHEQVEHMATASTPADDDVSVLSEEKEQLTQKMYHLNNELHRLLEQKYQMESESECNREELRKLAEQLTTVRTELSSKTDALQSLEAELQAGKDEMQTLQAELTSRNGKIDKCKAIIKEKIKETQRLQERERRAAYLEDELRMTQSRLEDYHNETLLLGRLKSEKDKLHATVGAEIQQRKIAEEQLAALQLAFDAQLAQSKALDEQLNHVDSFVKRYRKKWHYHYENPKEVITPEPSGTSDDFMGWISSLVWVDNCMVSIDTERTDAICDLKKVLENKKEYEIEMEQLETRLDKITSERDRYAEKCSEQDQSVKQLKLELDTKTADLHEAIVKSTLMESQQTELTAARAEIERLQEHLDRSQHAEQAELRNVIETSNRERLAIEQRLNEATQSNAELREEVTALRDSIQSLELELAAERSNITRLTESTANRFEEITQLRESLSEAEERYSKQCDRYKDYETIQMQLVEEKQQKDLLNQALKQREQEIQTLRHECDKLREHQDDAGKLQSLEMDSLKQRLYDMEQMHCSWETSLAQLRTENEEQTGEVALLRNTIASLERQTQEDETNISILTSLNGALNEDLDMLQQQTGESEQRYQSLLDELNQTKSALEMAEAQQCHLQQQTGESEQRYQSLLDELNQTKSALEAAEAQQCHLQQQTDDADERYRILVDELNQTKSALEAAEAQQCHLQQQTDDADERYRILVDEYDQKKLALEWAETAVQQERSRKEQLSSELHAKDQQCVQLQQKCAELRDECDQMQRTVDEMKSSAVRQEQPDTEPKLDHDLGMWDDADAGWGCADTTRLEALVREKDELIQQLGAEKDLMQQEITDLKVKSGKLLRKVKECRVKLDAQQSEPAGGRTASTESQDALEAKVRTLEQERTGLQREKEANELKLDMLESACEKLTEVKEHQDKQIEMLRESVATAGASRELEALREKVQQLTATLQTRESEISHLNARLEQLTGEVECIAELRAQLTESQCQNVQLQPADSVQMSASALHDHPTMELQLAELEHKNRLLEQDKLEMSRELEVLNQQILHDLQFEDRLNKALLELDAKGVEIQMLRSTLEQLQQGDGTVGATSETSQDTSSVQIASLESRIQELERERTELWQKLSAAGEANSPEADAIARVDDATVRDVLERQEVEIVTLKEQLALRSAEYARLAARVDPTKLFASGLGGSSEPVPKPEQQQPPAGDRVPQAELELALYMIYQRDMRCDELELELRNLLQERDTLQLRLSNALRMHEEFKIRLQSGTIPVDQEYGTSGECSIDASPDRSLSGLPVDERPVSSLSGPQDLTSKLSELQSISYSKEKRWQEEREERNRQLTLIQRDLANMPVEAAAKIAGTDVTADAETSTQQSASTVLLNWILGKK